MTKQLETRIAAALTQGDSIASAQVNALIEETSTAIAQGEADAAEEKERAFDPARSPDPQAARQKMEDALFLVGRLKTLLPRLEHLASQVWAKEQVTAFAMTRDVLQAEGDVIEQELVEIYHECSQRIVNALARASAFQDRVRRELPAIPPGVEAFRKFDASVAGLLANVVLVDLNDGKQQLWPKSVGTFAAEFSQSMAVPFHPGANWGAADIQAQRRKEIEVEQAHIARHMADASRQQEDRINAEARARAVAIRQAG